MQYRQLSLIALKNITHHDCIFDPRAVKNSFPFFCKRKNTIFWKSKKFPSWLSRVTSKKWFFVKTSNITLDLISNSQKYVKQFPKQNKNVLKFQQISCNDSNRQSDWRIHSLRRCQSQTSGLIWYSKTSLKWTSWNRICICQ